tara:strand:- start:238 stop:429 length:192 start_codon:yes stop_codon:yes gene_type:complete
MSKLSAYERERLKHINSVMLEIHSSADEIYESLVDREIEDLRRSTIELIGQLKDLLSSTEEDI